MKNAELMRCKNLLLKDTSGQISSMEKMLKSDLLATLKKYCDFEDKNIYFEMFENRGKLYVKFEANVSGIKSNVKT